MTRPCSAWNRLLVVMAIMALGVVSSVSLSPWTTTAQEPRSLPWETLSPPGPVYRLFMPAGGVLYALAGSGLYRSDDGGSAWILVPIPHQTQSSGSGQYNV